MKNWTVSTVDGYRVDGYFTKKEAYALAKLVSERTGYYAELRRNGIFFCLVGAVQCKVVDKKVGRR